MIFRRKRCEYCGRIPVMEHRKAARAECTRNSAQLFRVRCSCGNQTEWGLAPSRYWREKVNAMIVRQWNELNSEKLGNFFFVMIGEVRREAFRWGELKQCRMCREVPRSIITPCMEFYDYGPVAYWQIEIRCSRHADCDLIMQTQNDINFSAKRLAERWNWENAVDERGYITAFPKMAKTPAAGKRGLINV